MMKVQPKTTTAIHATGSSCTQSLISIYPILESVRVARRRLGDNLSKALATHNLGRCAKQRDQCRLSWRHLCTCDHHRWALAQTATAHPQSLVRPVIALFGADINRAR